MTRLSAAEPMPERFRGAIVALGNFDGFHQGHQAVAGEAIRWARAEGRPAIIATFDPHPVRYFRPDTPPFRLTTLDQREALFTDAGADAMLVFEFDQALATTSAADFVCDLLARRLAIAGVATGPDFTFGHRREGSIAQLAELGAGCGLMARTVGPVIDDGAPISSSRVRAALREGDCVEAERLLTRPFAIRGVVEHGAKLGRDLGWPTANLSLGNYLRPRYGVYAVRARLPDGRIVDGAANLGIRPQIEPPKELLEATLFDFSGDLYGREIEVALRRFLRPEAKFADLDALKAQIDADCAEARALLRAIPA